jgi:hypothetical protein
MTPRDIMEFFAFEPIDEVTRALMQRRLQNNFPGDYEVKILADRSGFEIIFGSSQSQTLWMLKHGPIG